MANSLLDYNLAEQLLAAARDAATRAYAPYSKFPVGAALLTEDGTVVTGCNVENISYGLTCCAERTAIFSAAAAGHRTVLAVAVSAPKMAAVTPCGACRQVLNEFRSKEHDLIVILDGVQGFELVPLATLLPRAFGPMDDADGTALAFSVGRHDLPSAEDKLAKVGGDESPRLLRGGLESDAPLLDRAKAGD